MLPLALGYVVTIAAAMLALDTLGISRTGPHGAVVYDLCLLAVNIVILVLLFVIIDRGRLISPASARIRDAELGRLRAVEQRAAAARRFGAGARPAARPLESGD
jgi:hypothetical protein